MEDSVLLEELSVLREFGNILLEYTEIKKVVYEVFKRINDKLHPK